MQGKKATYPCSRCTASLPFRGGALLFLLLALSLAFSVALPKSAFAVTAAEKQAEADEALVKLEALQDELDVAEADYHSAVSEQEEAQAKMDDAQERIDETQASIEDVQGQLSIRARSMYRSGASSALDMLLGCTSFSEFVSNWELLNRMNNNDAVLVQEEKDLKAQIEEEKAVYEEQEQIAAAAAAEAAKIEKQAQAAVDAMQETYDSLSEEAAELLEAERKAQEEAERAAAEAAAEAERIAAAEEAAQAAAAEEAAQAAAPAASSSGSSGSNSTGSSNSSSATESSSDDSGESNYSSESTESTESNYSSSSDSCSVAYNSSKANAIVSRAYSYVGNATYVWGACSPGQFDCSGFVSYCLSGQYSRLGTTYTFINWPRTYDPQPGDICVNSYHTGIYIGGGQMIHAAGTGRGVIIGSVSSNMIYVRHYC